MIPIRIAPHSLLLAVASAALLVASKPATGAEPTEVRISSFKFEQREVQVAPGTTIRWVNQDDEPHTVTSDDGVFASRGIDKDEKFTFTFDRPGTYPYHCALHPMMKGTVVVK